jgi:hypothetical protein
MAGLGGSEGGGREFGAAALGHCSCGQPSMYRRGARNDGHEDAS